MVRRTVLSVVRRTLLGAAHCGEDLGVVRRGVRPGLVHRREHVGGLRARHARLVGRDVVIGLRSGHGARSCGGRGRRPAGERCVGLVDAVGRDVLAADLVQLFLVTATSADRDHEQHQTDHGDRGAAGVGEGDPFVLGLDRPGDGDRVGARGAAVGDHEDRTVGLLVLAVFLRGEVGDLKGVRRGARVHGAPQIGVRGAADLRLPVGMHGLGAEGAPVARPGDAGVGGVLQVGLDVGVVRGDDGDVRFPLDGHLALHASHVEHARIDHDGGARIAELDGGGGLGGGGPGGLSEAAQRQPDQAQQDQEDGEESFHDGLCS